MRSKAAQVAGAVTAVTECVAAAREAAVVLIVATALLEAAWAAVVVRTVAIECVAAAQEVGGGTGFDTLVGSSGGGS